jgi:hypothetical protein
MALVMSQQMRSRDDRVSAVGLYGCLMGGRGIVVSVRLGTYADVSGDFKVRYSSCLLVVEEEMMVLDLTWYVWLLGFVLRKLDITDLDSIKRA